MITMLHDDSWRRVNCVRKPRTFSWGPQKNGFREGSGFKGSEVGFRSDKSIRKRLSWKIWVLCVRSKNTEIVVAKQNIAQEKQEALSRESEVITRQKGEAEVALAEAIPALEAAAEALNSLKKEEITEIRSFAKPNIYVQKVSPPPYLCTQLLAKTWSCGCC